MPAAESKKVTPLTTILPSSGVSTPAMQRKRAALAATRGTEQRHTLLAGLKLHVEHKPGIALFDIQNERHGLSTSLR